MMMAAVSRHFARTAGEMSVGCSMLGSGVDERETGAYGLDIVDKLARELAGCMSERAGMNSWTESDDAVSEVSCQ